MMKISFLLAIIFSCYSLYADVTLPKIFGDNMILQRNRSIPVWGWANANEKITVQFNHQTKKTKADKNGNWMIKLDNESAGGPYQLIIKAKNTVTFNNVLVGEVWICSGQSNMEFTVQSVINADKEIVDADYPAIRHFDIPNTISSTPEKDIAGGEWKVCSSATVGDFTAVGFFFAKELYNQLKVPIGLINSTWGGTMVESWTSRQAFENSDEFKNMIAKMPALNLDSLIKARTEETRKKIEALQGPLNADSWKELNTDDSKWPQMQLPNLWESQELGDLDGIVWFRKTVNLSGEDIAKAATIELAMIDDNDITYINGIKVGSTNSYNTKRKYAVPAGVFKEGKNVIAVRVEDTGGDGGIYGDSADLKLIVDNKAMPLTGRWYFKVEKVTGGTGSVGPNSYPTLLFNAMINPLIPYAIEGAIWYQGEANVDRAYQYRKAFPLMITDWRKRWNEGNFPFYFVQLATFNAANGNSKKGSTWAELREAQAKTLSLPNTGMSVTTDIGDPGDIHPKDKQDVGKRLAAITLHNVYEKNNVYSGPMYQSMKTENNEAIISFTNIGSGLMVKDKYGYIKGFEIAGADKQFHFAKACIDGNTVVVYSDSVPNPVAVHYGWADDAGDDNLYNKENFPVAPFRTDDWKEVTEGIKYEIRK
jgi:sialate O-acetylesterase